MSRVCLPHRGQTWSHHPSSCATQRGRKGKATLQEDGARARPTTIGIIKAGARLPRPGWCEDPIGTEGDAPTGSQNKSRPLRIMTIPSVAGCTTGSLYPRCPCIRDEVQSLYQAEFLSMVGILIVNGQ